GSPSRAAQRASHIVRGDRTSAPAARASKIAATGRPAAPSRISEQCGKAGLPARSFPSIATHGKRGFAAPQLTLGEAVRFQRRRMNTRAERACSVYLAERAKRFLRNSGRGL